MRKALLFALSVLFLLGAFTACAQADTGETETRTESLSQWDKREVPPSLSLHLTQEQWEAQEIVALQNSSTWRFYDQEGNVVFRQGDAPHPLQIPLGQFNHASFYLHGATGEISLTLSENYGEVVITARRWQINCQEGLCGMDNWENVLVSDGAIHLVNKGHDYIYEITVTWPQRESSATYVFSLFMQQEDDGKYSLEIESTMNTGDVALHFVADDTTRFFAPNNDLFYLEAIAQYHFFIDPDVDTLYEPGGQRIVFSTEVAVSQFQFMTLTYGEENFVPMAGEVLYSLDILNPEKPFVVEWVHVGCFTSGRGISFVDPEGVIRHFEIVLSNESGLLFLSEF